MTKTLSFTVLVIATAHVALAQSVYVPAPPAAPAPLARPAPRPAPAVVDAPFVFPPAPPEAPQAAPPAAPPPPAPILVEPFDFQFEPLHLDDLQFDLDSSLFDLKQNLNDLKESLKDQKFELQDSLKDQTFVLRAQQAPAVPAAPPRPARPIGGPRVYVRAGTDGSYDQARQLIERDQYERALPILDQVIQAKGTRADAAMYWKAYSLSKLARRPEALTVLGDLQKDYPNGPWLRDARSLEVEIRQASGQSVSADMPDDDVKLLALRGVMQSDPDAALPVIEKMLQGNSSVRVKDRALFLLNQNQSTRARDIIAGVAKNGSNPDLRLSAVRALGQRADPESQKLLADMYSSTSDLDARRMIIRSLGAANARDRLLVVARTEKEPELRAMAVQMLGAARGSTELDELYRSETDKTVKQRILQSFVAANATDRLAAIVRTEKDPDLLRIAIRSLGATNRPEAVDALVGLYRSPDTSTDTKKLLIEGLSIHQNCTGLVGLAKAEKNKELQTEIVRRLSTQSNRCAEARDYMLELLK